MDGLAMGYQNQILMTCIVYTFKSANILTSTASTGILEYNFTLSLIIE